MLGSGRKTGWRLSGSLIASATSPWAATAAWAAYLGSVSQERSATRPGIWPADEYKPEGENRDGRRDGQAKRPSGSQIVGWVAIVFCGLLAFVNAATIASSDGMRAFLIVAGVVLIGIFVTLLGRWFFKRGNPAGPKGR